ncbi:MAG: RNA polymerase sigma factor (sigma-70 family) [Mariniblastus sp.]
MTNPIDPRELGRLLDENAKSLSLYAAQWTTAPDDCVQEAFVALAAMTERPESAKAWLFRAVRNLALNELRSSQRRVTRESQAAESHRLATDPALITDANEQREALLKKLDGLEACDREVILLRIWSELTWQEIAELTETSSSSAQRRYAAALEKLRIELEKKCLTK